MLTPSEKSPLLENFPRGGSNPRRCGQRAQTLPTSYSGPSGCIYLSIPICLYMCVSPSFYICLHIHTPLSFCRCVSVSKQMHISRHLHMQYTAKIAWLDIRKHKPTGAVTQSLLVGCLTSQQHASVSQGRICSDNFTCCHTEIEVADQTFYLTQSQYTDTGLTSPSADPIMPGAWQGSHWSASF